MNKQPGYLRLETDTELIARVRGADGVVLIGESADDAAWRYKMQRKIVEVFP